MTPPRLMPTPQFAAQEDSLGATAEVFSNRMQRRLKEQEARQSEDRRALSIRQSLLLQAMTTVRKALNATSRIDLGKRFSFDLNVSDWEGWPRIELRLVDTLAPNRVDHSLIITAFDRKSIGSIQMNLHSGEVLGRLHLEQPAELEKLPLMLKKAVREFLDSVSEYVLNPRSPQELVEVQARPIENDEIDPAIDSEGKELGKAELFGEEAPKSDQNVVENIHQVTPLDL